MKRMIAALAVLAITALGAPAAAAEPIDGTVTMNANPGFGTGPCPEVTWAGALTFADANGADGAYGLILSSNDVEGVFRGPWYLFQENWALTNEVPEFDADGMLVSCRPGTVLMSGWDAGVGSAERGEFWDTGFVETATAPFEDWLGARTYQDGLMTMVVGPEGTPIATDYEGTFRLQF